MTKHTINVQDGFLFHNLKTGSALDIELTSGKILTGRLKRFDRFAVVIESDGDEMLIYKHAIALISGGVPGP